MYFLEGEGHLGEGSLSPPRKKQSSRRKKQGKVQGIWGKAHHIARRCELPSEMPVRMRFSSFGKKGLKKKLEKRIMEKR